MLRVFFSTVILFCFLKRDDSLIDEGVKAEMLSKGYIDNQTIYVNSNSEVLNISYLVLDTIDSERTFLFIHGVGTNRFNLAKNYGLDKVAIEKNARLLIIEYPGFGDQPGNYSISDVVNAIDAIILKEHNMNDFYIVGNSHGSAVALEFAKRSKFDSKIKKYILFAPYSTPFEASKDDKTFGKYIKLTGSFLKSLFEKYFGHDNLSNIKNITCSRIVIIQAGRDSVTPVRHGEELARSSPGSQYIVMENEDHESLLSSLHAWRLIEL